MADGESLQATEEHKGQPRSRDDDAQSPHLTSRDQLFSRLAIHNGFVEQETLEKVIQHQSANPCQSIADILVQGGAISEEVRRVIEQLLHVHVAQHGNDPQKSLSSLSASLTESQGSAGQARSASCAEDDPTR